MNDVESGETEFLVDAAVLGQAFDLSAEAVRAMMQNGRITSRCEVGVGEDNGRWRLIFYYQTRVCRLTVLRDGAIVNSVTFDAPWRQLGTV